MPILDSNSEIRTEEKGNVFFLILIGVVLFAALAYVISQSGRTGGKDASQDKLNLKVSELAQYATDIENAIVRIKVSNNCSDNEISFYMPGIADLAAYEHTPDNRPECRVFDPQGGGVSYEKPPKGVNPGQRYSFSTIAAVNIGTSKQELIMNLTNLTKEICSKINEKFGVANYNGDLPDTNSTNTPFTGTYDDAASYYFGGGGYAAVPVQGTTTGCFNQLSSGNYWFYHVLIER